MAEGIRIRATHAARGLDIDVTVPAGATLAVVGPNGAGKSSLLELVSGDLVPDAGHVTVDGRVLTGPGVHVPPHRRPTGYVEQRPLLFPHLTVAENVAFGLRASGVGRRASLDRAHEELAAVGCGHLSGRRPRDLSGGQQQRVSIARSLATDPEVLLLDEPFAALDAAVAPEIRRLLRERLAGMTTLLATHDLLDVVALADTMIEMADGAVTAQGDVDDLCQRPASTFLAGFVGVNLLHGRSRGDATVWLDASTAIAGLAQEPLTAGLARAVFAPSAVSVFRDAPHGSPRNELPASVAAIEDRWPVQRVLLDVAGQRIAADLTPSAVRDLELAPGHHVVAVVKATQVSLHPGGHCAP